MERAIPTAVVLPTYNEADNLTALVQALLALPNDLTVIVVDDNSPDGTGELADHLARQTGRVLVRHRPGKLGLGTAYVEGFRTALAHGAQRIVTMDADFSHHPRYLPNVIALTEEAALGIGSRYVRGGATLNWGLHRQLLSALANTLARAALRLPSHDCTAGFRCYRREVLEAVNLDSIRSNGYSFLIEMLYQVTRHGFRVAETPILFEDRRFGQSKISEQEIMRAAMTVVRLSTARHR
ncbi:MAG: polyprenol monophosphomannose synthase [Anaerolineae bacterium]|nr:polyprenol monophosphomannose synthase [Anaerolineae bacterium]